MRRPTHTYDIHGIVTVASEVRLPELERFRVSELPRAGRDRRAHRAGEAGERPARERCVPCERRQRQRCRPHERQRSRPHERERQRQRCRPHERQRQRAVHTNGNGAAHTNGNGNGAVHTNGANGNGNGAVHTNGNGVRPRAVSGIRYAEGRGRSASRVEITEVGDRIEVVASPLLRCSPHVLYTNVVEPILRWTFVEQGLRAGPRGLLRRRRARLHDHGPHRHRQDDHER